MESMRMQGKVALVTGASRGIGRASALRLAREGAKVVLFARSAEKLEEVAAEIEALGREALVVPGDVSSEADNAKMVSEALAAFGQLNAAFLCAGTLVTGPIAETKEADLDTLLAVNVKSIVFALKSLVPAMKERGGSIIIASSVAGSTASANSAGGNGVYSATKAAVNMLVKFAAAEAAPTIRVNGISPGIVDTDMAAPFDGVELAKQAHLIQRAGTPDEVASLVAYLASEESAFVTGSDFLIDGGYALKN